MRLEEIKEARSKEAEEYEEKKAERKTAGEVNQFMRQQNRYARQNARDDKKRKKS